MEETGQVLSKEQSVIIERLDKSLQEFKGKQVLIDTNNDIVTNQLYKDFAYKFFQNCEK
jgi:hypothetical protein